MRARRPIEQDFDIAFREAVAGWDATDAERCSGRILATAKFEEIRRVRPVYQPFEQRR